MPGARSSGVISLGCLIEGADNFSTNTPGGTFTLFDPRLARISTATFELRETVGFLVLENVF
jgi:hypothetical protein